MDHPVYVSAPLDRVFAAFHVERIITHLKTLGGTANLTASG
jgi:hypothetical protein